MSGDLEHSARIAHARETLAEFRAAIADETVPYDSAGWAGRLVGTLEMTLAADRDGDLAPDIERQVRQKIAEEMRTAAATGDYNADEYGSHQNILDLADVIEVKR